MINRARAELREHKAVFILWALLEASCLVTGVTVGLQKDLMHTAACFGTMALLLLPWFAEWLFRVELPAALKIGGLLLAFWGPVGGSVYKLYYAFAWWDDLLHFSSGFMLSALGFLLVKSLNGGEKGTLLLRVVFAFCFALTIGALHEFFEYGCDRLLGMEMQGDRVITGFHSYLLGEAPGLTGYTGLIESVSINGTPLPVAGYIDTGIIDTMSDMLLGACGAVLYCIIGWFTHKQKGREA